MTILEPGESTRFFSVKIGFSHPNPPFFSLREPSRALARLRRRSIPVVASVHTLLFLIWGLSDTLYHFFSPKYCSNICHPTGEPYAWIKLLLVILELLQVPRGKGARSYLREAEKKLKTVGEKDIPAPARLAHKHRSGEMSLRTQTGRTVNALLLPMPPTVRLQREPR